MFPLQSKVFPESAEALARLLNESLREVLFLRADAVSVVPRKYPALEEIAMVLDGAEVRPHPPKPRRSVGPTEPALEVERLSVRGDGVVIGPAGAHLALKASGVRLNRGNDADGNIVLGLDSAADGSVEISTGKSDLEAAIAEVARREAGKQGVTIEEVRLTLRETGPRSVAGEAQLRARKLFFSATVQMAAQLTTDDELQATVSGLRCHGEGVIGNLACGFLQPYLQKLEGRQFALMAFALGDVRLRDVTLAAGEEITVRAEFGS